MKLPSPIFISIKLFSVIEISHIVILPFKITEEKDAKDLKLRSMKKS